MMTNLSGANLNNGVAVGSNSEGRNSPSHALAAMPKYEAYKESGVEWLGGIPSEWDLIANKHIFTLKKRLVGKRSSLYDLLSLTLRGVIKRDMENPEGKFPAEFDTYQEVAEGDFVFCLFDVEETPRTVGLSPFNGMITGAYTVFECLPDFEKRFLYYFYLNLDGSKRMKPLYKGLRNTIPKDAFLSFKTFAPKKSIQTAIANFLDQKTAQIDEAIAIKEKQIALLKERKQIIIQKAVTQGLNPDVSMKDSGVDWIGKIPECWKIVKSKRVFWCKGGYAFPSQSFGDSGVPVLRISNIQDATISMKGMVYVDQAKDKIVREFSAYSGDLIFCMTGAGLGKVGVLPKYLDGSLVNQRVGRIDVNDQVLDKRFAFYVLSSLGFQTNIRMLGAGLTDNFPNISSDQIASIEIALPPIDSQTYIVDELESRLKRLEESLVLFTMQIDKLKEYKATLINSAVTGKVKVA